MVVWVKNWQRVARCLDSSYVATPRPALSFSFFSSLTPSDASATAERRVTRKRYAELPTSFVLPDGTPATPLPNWRGGINHRYRTSNLQSIENEDASEAQNPKRRRGRRVKETDPEGNDAQRSTSSSSQAVELKDPLDVPTRALKRKPKTRALTDPEIIDKQPRNQLAQEILENLKKFSHCILLTRVGQFYESYFDQAIDVARLLNIKLASRKWDGQRIPMCGFPLMHLDKYLKVLVQENKLFVAMCEEFPKHSTNSVKEFDRRVVRVITPGTLIDESFLNPYENNYLLAIAPSRSTILEPDSQHAANPDIGLAWIDVSTGEFVSSVSSMETLRDDLTRINPREIVLQAHLQSDALHPIRQVVDEEGSFVSYMESASVISSPHLEDPNSGGNDVSPVHSLPPSNTDIASRLPTLSPSEANAIHLVTSYLRKNLLEHMPSLTSPHREGNDGRMQIDSHTIKALELKESIGEGGIHGSLLSVIKRTVTSSGTRLLTRWLCSPSTSISEINTRQSLVAFFHMRPHIRTDLLALLKNAEDTDRIVQKFLLSRGETSDLLSINATIQVWSNIKKFVEEEKRLEALEQQNYDENDWAGISSLMSRMCDLQDLSTRVRVALSGSDQTTSELQESDLLVDDPSLANGGDPQEGVRPAWRIGLEKRMINPAFSPRLAALHATFRDLLGRREDLELEFQRKYKAPSLTLRSSPAHGLHVHLANMKRDQGQLNKLDTFIGIAESGSTKCYFNQEWSKLGTQIIETSLQLDIAEREAFEILRNEVTSHTSQLRHNARILGELDVTLAFANLAIEINFVRPVIKDDATLVVRNGRHPTVELGLWSTGRVFTPNSISMTPDSPRLHIITGPNMAGKSTLLRQAALITILAQTGSFVPADFAEIGIVDQLFSRIGAKDDLFHDRSTFMVEMLETAEILRRATPKSLVIMDEVGRGTTVKDGLAIAFATVHHLVSVNRCRGLFATHFHELADLLGYSSQDHTGHGLFQDVSFYCTNVDEASDQHFAYSYRVQPGVNRDSHGLKVAQLAGMPQSAISVAQDTLTWLQARKEEQLPVSVLSNPA